jgi:hypothetical protein
MLHYFDLSDSAPKAIKDAVFQAQQIRNVWAHHAGRVDAHFVKYASHLAFRLGDKVTVNVEDTNKYITGVLMYGAIIANRWRERNGSSSTTSFDSVDTVVARCTLSVKAGLTLLIWSGVAEGFRSPGWWRPLHRRP